MLGKNFTIGILTETTKSLAGVAPRFLTTKTDSILSPYVPVFVLLTSRSLLNLLTVKWFNFLTFLFDLENI